MLSQIYVRQPLHHSMGFKPTKKQLVISKNETYALRGTYGQFRNRRQTLSDFLLPKKNPLDEYQPRTFKNYYAGRSEHTDSVTNESSRGSTEDLCSFHPLFRTRQSSCRDFRGPYDNYKRKLTVDLCQTPLKRYDRSYSVERIEKKFENNQEYINKIILIQSFLRKFFLRKKVYNMIYKYYVSQNLLQKFIKASERNVLEIKRFCFCAIKGYRKRKYFINPKEKLLLDELRRKKIKNINDLKKYFVWLKSGQ